MFGWFRKKRLKEQWKLIYQNDIGLKAVLPGWLEERPDKEANDLLHEMTLQHDALTEKSTDENLLSPEDMLRAVEINTAARKLYDTMGMATFGSFDKACQPIGGWDEAWERRH